MVQVNTKKREISIITDGNSSDVVQMQRALIDLLQHYNFEDFGNAAEGTFYYALSLLENLLPDYDQQHRDLISEANYLELPESLNPKQVEAIREALLMVNHPETKVRAEPNPVHEAIKSIAV